MHFIVRLKNWIEINRHLICENNNYMDWFVYGSGGILTLKKIQTLVRLLQSSCVHHVFRNIPQRTDGEVLEINILDHKPRLLRGMKCNTINILKNIGLKDSP